MEKWREDAQPERLDAAGAFEEFPENDEDRNRSDTRLLPRSGGSAEPGAKDGADIYEADPDAGAEAGAGFDSLEDRWARLGVLSGGNDRTQVLSGASRPADPPAATDGTAPAGDREDARGGADRTAPASGDRADDPWDAERTTALRVPRPRVPGAPGVRVTWPSSPAGPRTPARDPWQEEAAESAAATHDPHEVTVQLDAVQFGDGVLRRAPAAPGRAGGGQDASDGPVFVDESGRRGRRYRRIGMAAGVACAGYAVVIVATLLSGNSNAPWLPVPGQQKDRPAGQVDTSPQPAGTESVPGSGTSLLPGGTPTAGDTTPPSPGAEAPAPGATGRPDEPGTTTGPAPTPTRSTQEPGTGADAPTPTPPAETPTTPAPDPTPTDDPAPETTAPTGGDDAGDVTGTDNRAGAPAGPPVVAGSPAARPEPSATPATAPSPEYVL